MATRRVSFVNGEYYHIYNRGVDKRNIFSDRFDRNRFFQSMQVFNVKDPIGSFRSGLVSDDVYEDEPLVEIVAYCLNPNHFHLVLRQISAGGISEFMKRLSGGYTGYFNLKHKRSGSLFQGRFKAIHIGANEYLLHVSAYVNLNFRVHNYNDQIVKRIRSSWDEYVKEDFSGGICVKNVVLGQFRDAKKYEIFAEQSLKGIVERKKITRALRLEE